MMHGRDGYVPPSVRRRRVRGTIIAAIAASVAVVVLAATTGAADASTPMPQGSVRADGATWDPIYSEDFDTPAALGDVMTTYPRMRTYASGKDTSGKGEYAPNRVLTVHNGVLDWNLHSEKGQPLATSVLPNGYRSGKHMRVSIRYRADPVPGYKFVMILWPLSDDWNEGEIDWPEGELTQSARPATAIPGSLRVGKGVSFLPGVATDAPTDQSGWHVATVDWTASAVSFYWDDTLVAKVTEHIPDTQMRITLQAETADGSDAVPVDAAGHVQVDWIVAYKESDQD